jgi:hypothetical protein
MTDDRTEAEERTELLSRLRTMASDDFADRYVAAPLNNLRHAVESGEAQLRLYAECGFEDMAGAGSPR